MSRPCMLRCWRACFCASRPRSERVVAKANVRKRGAKLGGGARARWHRIACVRCAARWSVRRRV
eukprot:6187507-Pleurochrysis_carterae.AAC.2